MDIRRALGSDYEAFAALFPELVSGDPTPDRARWASEIAPHAWLATRGDDVLGYIFLQRLAREVYVRHVVVAPGARGCGTGRALMEFVRAQFRDLDRWRLNVKPENAAAIGLYRAMGMTVAHASTAMRATWDQLSALPAPARGVVAGDLEPVLDGAAERAMDLPLGQLAHARSTGRRVVCAIDGAEVAALAVFDPGFPGAFPFRARTVPHARALCDGLRPHARQDYLNFVVEGDPGLRQGMLDAGATVRMETLHMVGTLRD